MNKMSSKEWNDFVRTNPFVCAEKTVSDPEERRRIREMIDEAFGDEHPANNGSHSENQVKSKFFTQNDRVFAP